MGNLCGKPISEEPGIALNELKVEERHFEVGTIKIIKRLDGKVVGWIDCENTFRRT